MFCVFQDLRQPLICVSPVNFSFQPKNPLKVDEKARGDFTRRKVQAYFATQQLDTSDARELFNLLDQDGDGEVESFGWVESWKWMALVGVDGLVDIFMSCIVIHQFFPFFWGGFHRHQHRFPSGIQLKLLHYFLSLHYLLVHCYQVDPGEFPSLFGHVG